MPSRASFFSGKCGIRNGIVNHGGEAAELFIKPEERGFKALLDNFVIQLRKKDFYTVTVSPFGERHSAFWFYNGFREMYNTGKSGGERADEIVPVALDWLDRRGKENNWYLHVNVWDPHTAYKVPDEFGNPFENDPPPEWMSDEIRKKTWDTYGPGCAREPGGDYLGEKAYEAFPRMPLQIDSMEAYKKWVDGYDTGVWYADKHVGLLVDKLEELGLMDDTMIIVTADHGENLGELAVYGDHQTADHITNRVPMIIKHPKGLGGVNRVDNALRYHFDVAATVIEMTGGKVPGSWDGQSFLRSFEKETEDGREYLVVSNCTWACQRSVRWKDHILIKTYHTGFKNYPDTMLFNVKDDPHELNDLSGSEPGLLKEGETKLKEWYEKEMKRSPFGVDPMETVLKEGGPYHATFRSEAFDLYLKRLRETGRESYADDLEIRKKEWEKTYGGKS